ncbi:phosphate transport system permease protein [Haloarcula vallismortis]|uniref:Phosphate transport system permease protein PstA n=2 Tax=Haloarcula vallismortis TaxID=28442 RepID=M0JQN7_HALVA|nr:phosphate ABC transporter permease PstA [Haloarcula vallismortis]EMA11306.1 phosphate ABC transporter permease [Haloarcula vallismortis ATCC 29715]SDW37465.1 phosphate transport system permease protein [Haloarcula vallismortis]
MATPTSSETTFESVSRTKGAVFEYLTLGASLFGLVALGVLLLYVFWDAFGLATAEIAWYGALVICVVAPTLGFVAYARRNTVAGEVALELVSTAMGGLLAGFGVIAVIEVIAGPAVWFAYFLTVVAPLVGLFLYNRARPEVTWVGLAMLGVLIAGPIIGTLTLDTLTQIESLIGGPFVYLLSLVLPAAVIARYVIDDYLELGNGNFAAGLVVAVAFFAVPLIDTLPLVSRSVWLIFLSTLVTPLGIVAWKNLAAPENRVGFAGPGIFIGGVGLLLIVTDALGLSGPTPWFDWQYLTSNPSRFADQAGLYSAIIGSVFIIVLVALITLALGVGAAIFLEEYAPDSGPGAAIARLIRINISNLAGVPSVVYGILGLAVFANLVGLGFGTVITAALTLSLLILPIVIISAREAIRAVPDSIRNASYGMGATKWQTTRNIVLPRAIPGILTGTILALGRAIGETAPLIMIGVATTKFSPPSGLFSKTTAMPMQIFAWSSYPSAEFQHGVVAAGVVTLLVVLLTMNSIAILLRNKFETEEL